MRIYLDGKIIKSKKDLYEQLNKAMQSLIDEMIDEKAKLSESLDAVYDLLSDTSKEVEIHVINALEMLSEDRGYFDRLMRMLRALKNENGNIHYEICDHEIEPESEPESEIESKSETESVTEIAYAKINLSLDVTGKLDNGYHLVKMVMASISLHDTLTFTKSSTPGIRLTMESGEGVLSSEGLSLADDNLIIKAAGAILSEDNLSKKGLKIEEIGLDILLKKNIPMAAGMAGGSADAAAALRGLNRLYELNLSKEQLCDLGVRLGADIPFCVLQGYYLSEGIGEVLTKLPSLQKVLRAQSYIALIKPPIDVSTKFVYEHLDNEGIDIHPNVEAQLAAINNGDLYGIAEYMRNVLRDVTVPAYPIVLELEEFLKDNGAINAMMSGSGPTVFGIFDDEDKCRYALLSAKSKYPGMFTDMVSFI